ncbi:hypothetical protein [Thalassospira marina]|uniref:hypothetical protein n=1 Tax=Thalassospira marina TaxID=2048283 RepID=UPI0010550801|nr:hypothetical protein [Thalassospira marina]
MNTVDDVIARIRRFVLQNNMTKSRFALQCGLQVDVTRKMWDADWNPTIATLRQLEKPIPDDFQVSANDPGCPGEKAA